MESYKQTNYILDDKSQAKKDNIDGKDCTSNKSLLKNTYFFRKYNTKSLFKNSHNYDIAFLSENISEWDNM